jgi:hypothetical protein
MSALASEHLWHICADEVKISCSTLAVLGLAFGLCATVGLLTFK